jgi:hypothetical protein
MTAAQLETEGLALLAQEHELLEALARLRLTPNDRPAHAAHHARLAAHDERIRAYRYALTHPTPE